MKSDERSEISKEKGVWSKEKLVGSKAENWRDGILSKGLLRRSGGILEWD